MKLRNKNTGKIGRVVIAGDSYLITEDNEENRLIGEYQYLKWLLEDWEDYKEPKEYWHIDINGEIMFDNVEDDIVKVMREIGNYFETREEAEKAVEKLKAWKRLKDKGFVFKGINEGDGSIKTGLSKGVSLNNCEEFYCDMVMLFGGEE